MRILFTCILITLAIVISGCGGGGGTTPGDPNNPGQPGDGSVVITPSSAVVAVGATQQFSASGTVTWDVEEASGGEVSTSGLYTAPATPGTYHVVATSATDNTKTDSAQVIVVPWSDGGGVSSGGYRVAAVWGAEGGSVGAGRGQFHTPRGLAVGPSNHVYVSDSGNNVVQQFANNGVYISEVSLSGSATGNVPVGWAGPVAFNSSGDMYMLIGAGGVYTQMYRRSAAGATVAWAIGANPAVDLDVTGLTSFVTNATTSGIKSIWRIGGINTPGGYWVGTVGDFESPAGVAIDSSGNLYAADRARRVILKYSGSSRTLIRTISVASLGVLEPYGVDVDSSGSIYVTDIDGDKVYKLTNTGTLVTSWGSTGTGAGQFAGPTWVKVDSTGGVFVLDAGNSRVQKFVADGS